MDTATYEIQKAKFIRKADQLFLYESAPNVHSQSLLRYLM